MQSNCNSPRLLTSNIQHLSTVALAKADRTLSLNHNVIVSEPNVGKSSLINSIVRSERAIVSELPGTTRDAIDIVYERDGLKSVFIDTAGIRRRGKVANSAEVFSVMRAERSIRRADLCILVIDLTMGVTAQDKRIAGLIQKARKSAIVSTEQMGNLVSRDADKNTSAKELLEETRSRIFFLTYAPVLITYSQVVWRKCRWTLCIDPKNPTRGAEAHPHRSLSTAYSARRLKRVHHHWSKAAGSSCFTRHNQGTAVSSGRRRPRRRRPACHRRIAWTSPLR